MVDDRKNCSAGFVMFFLLIAFFAFIQREKEKNATGRSIISPVAVASFDGMQAIIGQAISLQEAVITWFIPDVMRKGCTNGSSARNLVFSNQVSFFFNTSNQKFLSIRPFTGLIFLQKIPEQGKGDDLLPLT